MIQHTIVEDIIIYPIKGMQGISLSIVNVLDRGLQHDRRLMLVDEEGTFISQRTLPQLVFFKPTIEDNILSVQYQDQDLAIDFIQSKKLNSIRVSVFEHQMDAYLISNEVDQWFSDILKKQVRLVFIPEDGNRTKVLKRGAKEEVPVSFADGYPILIASTASLEHLNKKLNSPIKMDRFRPNIIVTSDQPHGEDHWDIISIGSCQLQIIKPCARCSVVTIDQNSGEKLKEPLKILSTYRTINRKVYFGANAIVLQKGTIAQSDQITILSSQDQLVY